MIELIVVGVLLVVGYVVGSGREKKHYTSIKKREEALKHILIFESKALPEGDSSSGQLVQGNVVISSDYFKMFVAGLRKLVGGRLTTFESLLDRGRREAILRLKREAVLAGANMVFNVRFETSAVSQGANGAIGSIEVLAYGSAIKHQVQDQ